MSHSYIAYVDESGDDGLRNFRGVGDVGGSSTWLVISACVFRATHDLSAVAWRDEILARMPKRQSRDLHFSKLNHEQKVAASHSLSGKPMRAINVLYNKLLVPDGVYRQKNQLYFYLTRYLVERISWLCRDYRRFVREGDGRVKIIFSRRGGMSYSDFRAYLLRLRLDETVRIHWQVIDIDGIDAHDHSRLAGLQLVDAIATAYASGVEPNFYGNCEHRYAKLLKPITYCRNKNYFSYGVKLVPPVDEMELSADQQRCVDLFK